MKASDNQFPQVTLEARDATDPPTPEPGTVHLIYDAGDGLVIKDAADVITPVGGSGGEQFLGADLPTVSQGAGDIVYGLREFRAIVVNAGSRSLATITGVIQFDTGTAGEVGQQIAIDFQSLIQAITEDNDSFHGPSLTPVLVTVDGTTRIAYLNHSSDGNAGNLVDELGADITDALAPSDQISYQITMLTYTD